MGYNSLTDKIRTHLKHNDLSYDALYHHLIKGNSYPDRKLYEEALSQLEITGIITQEYRKDRIMYHLKET